MTENMTVPKSMGKMKEDNYKGIPFKLVMFLGLWLVVSLFILAPMLLLSGIIQYISIAVLIIWWGIFIKWFRSPVVLNRTLLMLKYLNKMRKGETLYAKYIHTIPFMEKIVPIRDVSKTGVIKFIGNRYGLLLKAQAPHVSDDDLERHLSIVRKNVVDGLHGNLCMKVIATSKVKRTYSLLDYILSAMNLKGKPKESKKHLYELWKEINEDETEIIDWDLKIFVEIGECEDDEDAEITKQEYLPGVISGLRKAGIMASPITNRSDIAIEYRQIMSVE